MNYRTLGRSGIQVSEIGFGAWGIGGSHKGAIAYGPTIDNESRKALRKAFDLGVTFYDTADLYGYGHSEALIGQELKSQRHNIMIASKVGMLDHSGGQNFSVDHIQTSIEKSMRRLQTDYIDLYQLHDPPLHIMEDEAVLGCLSSLKKEGKVRSLGISVRSPEDALTAIKQFEFESVQVNFNMLDQRAVECGVMDLCRNEGVGIVVRTPLCFGFLAGQLSAETDFDGQDHRKNWSISQKECWANAPQLFNLAPESGCQTEAQKALRYCLSYPEVSTVIPGMLSEKEVTENVGASQMGPLQKTELKRIQDVYKEHTFFLGKTGAN
ncbi:aldo/keto reductase [Candidatus Nitronereus thalassa]|uniref:Aldo/keto reductase n=1 Tax=Candidatus Nitronereus thalassa TaxID=3020898 RepID=A0ABU3K5K2_9BACT|nr:aldo/keto reductase [Candidatus Nitronereus thalassa]MDT7041670.1 aldo/keto reductase [Candidatus Nitronereus thalassa]